MANTKRTTAIVSFVAVLAGTVALNAVLGLGSRSLRIDCTEERLYTLSSGVKELVRTLDEPVKLDLYWSASIGNDVPQLRTYAQRVKEFLTELSNASGGTVRVRQIDPEPSSEAEDEARAAGLASLQVDGAGRTLTLGLVVRGSTDKSEVLPYLDPAQESFLEYEVARRILAVKGGKKPVVAVISSLPMQGSFDQRTMQPTQPPVIIRQLQQLFDVRPVEVNAPKIPDDASVLVVVQPHGFGEEALKAIDGWVVAGKPTLAFLDPWCETDPQSRQMAMQGGAAGSSFEAPGLLNTLGIDIPTDSVVGDKSFATRVRARTPAGMTMELDYLPWLALPREAFAKGDPVVGSIATLNLMSVGSIRKREGGTTTVEPFVSSSTEAQLIQTMKLGFFGQPDQLIKDFVSLNASQSIAARISGPVTSAFPAAPSAPPAEGAAAPPAAEPAKGNANVIVIADADLLDDQTWVMEDRFAGQSLGYRAIADNGSLVLNAIEALSGDRVLAGLRGRGEFRRPFDRVETIRRDAEAKYLSKEQELEQKIQQSQTRISELQREKTGAGANALILSPEQEAELNKLEETMAASRKELREVQYRLRRDIDSLGSGLMLANVALWPALVAIGASAWTARRMFGQRRGGGGR
jgi:ABC-type uncharacterized transport system involved in gliding motility auxiliary subunit